MTRTTTNSTPSPGSAGPSASPLAVGSTKSRFGRSMEGGRSDGAKRCASRNRAAFPLLSSPRAYRRARGRRASDTHSSGAQRRVGPLMGYPQTGGEGSLRRPVSRRGCTERSSFYGPERMVAVRRRGARWRPVPRRGISTGAPPHPPHAPTKTTVLAIAAAACARAASPPKFPQEFQIHALDVSTFAIAVPARAAALHRRPPQL